MDGPIAITSGAIPAYQGNQLKTKVRMNKDADLVTIDEIIHFENLLFIPICGFSITRRNSG